MKKTLEPNFGELLYYKPDSLEDAYNILRIKLSFYFDKVVTDKEYHLLKYDFNGKTTLLDSLNNMLRIVLFVDSKTGHYGIELEQTNNPIWTVDDDNAESYNSITLLLGSEKSTKEIHALFYWINFLSK